MPGRGQSTTLADKAVRLRTIVSHGRGDTDELHVQLVVGSVLVCTLGPFRNLTEASMAAASLIADEFDAIGLDRD